MISSSKNAIGRLEVLDASGRIVNIGTAFLAGPQLVLTAYHVVADRMTSGWIPLGTSLRIVFVTTGRTVRVETKPVDHDQGLDFAALRLTEPPDWDIVPIPIIPTPTAAGTEYRTWGFAELNPGGFAVTGTVTDPSALIGGHRAIQLFANEAAAPSAVMKGLSGSPCITGGGAFGLVRTFPSLDQRTVAAATLYACSSSDLVERTALRDQLAIATDQQPRPMSREELRQELLALSSSQFDDILFKLGLHERPYMLDVTRADRAASVITLCQQADTSLAQLRRALDEVEPGLLERGPPPRTRDLSEARESTHRDILLGLILSGHHVWSMSRDASGHVVPSQLRTHRRWSTFLDHAATFLVERHERSPQLYYGIDARLYKWYFEVVEPMLGPPPDEATFLAFAQLQHAAQSRRPAWRDVAAAVGPSLAAMTKTRTSLRRVTSTLHRPHRTAVDFEYEARMQRVDFPVVIDDIAVVLGLVPVWSTTNTRRDLEVRVADHDLMTELTGASSGWQPADAGFHLGLNNARAAAILLLSQLGVSPAQLEPYTHATVVIHGVIPPAKVSDGSAGLPFALRILQEVSGLGAPKTLCTGAINDGLLVPVDSGIARAKAEAMRIDGFHERLLVHASDSTLASASDVTVLRSRELRAAAREYFGEPWNEWISSIVSEQFKKHGFVLGWPEGIFAGAAELDGVPLIAESSRVGEIVRAIEEGKSIVLMDWPRTGKTWIAQGVTQELQHRGWHVFVLSSLVPGLDVDAEVRDIIEQELLRAGVTNRTKTLIVIDGIHGEGEPQPLIEVLGALGSMQWLVVVSAVDADQHTAWVTDDLQTLSAMDAQHPRQIAEQLLVKHDALAPAWRMLDVILARVSDNIEQLVHMLRDVALSDIDDFSGTATRIIDSATKRVRELRLDNAERDAAAAIASVSPLGIGCWLSEDEEARLAPRLRELGARKRSDGWHIASALTCEAVLLGTLRAETTPNIPISALPLSDHLAALIDADKDKTLLRVLDALSMTAGHLSDAVERTGGKLHRWAMKDTRRSDHLARALLLLGEHLPPYDPKADAPSRYSWARRLCELLVKEVAHPATELEPNGLRICADALRLNLDLINSKYTDTGFDDDQPVDDRSDDDRAADRRADATTPYGRLVGALDGGGLVNVLRHGRSKSRIRLFMSLEKIADARLLALLARHIGSVLVKRVPYATEDYRAAFETNRFLMLLARNRPADVAREDERRFYVCDVLSDMLKPQRNETSLGIEAVMYRQMLRETVRGEDRSWMGIANDVKARIPHAPLPEVARALRTSASFDRRMTVKVTPLLNLHRYVRSQLERSSMGQVASFLGVISNLHAATAFEILYGQRSDCTPDTPLAHLWSKQIKESGDIKGGSLLLRAISRIDAIYGSARAGMAHFMADHCLRKDFFLVHLRNERRTLILYHLVDAALASEVSFIGDLQETIIDRLSILLRSSTRPGPARLAQLLSHHDSYGRQFMEALENRLDPVAIADRILSMRELSGLAYFLELAWMFPRIGAELVHDPARLGELVSRIFRSWHRTEIRVRAALALTSVLHRTGHHDLVKIRSQGYWRHAVRHSRAEALPEVLSGLRRLYPDVAAQVVARQRSQIMEATKRCYEEPAIACDILNAALQCNATIARGIYQELLRHTSSWSKFMTAIEYEQDPRTQSRCFLQLARLGHRPTPTTQGHLESRWLGDSGIEIVRSPAAITDLLRMFGCCDVELAKVAASHLHIDKVARRVGEGALVDLPTIADLLGVLHGLGEERAVKTLLSNLQPLLAEFASRAGLEATARLSSLLGVLDEGLARRLATAARPVFESACSWPIVAKERRHWQAIAWFGLQCAWMNMPMVLPEVTPTLQQFHNSSVYAFVVGSLSGGAVEDQQVHETIDEVLATAPGRTHPTTAVGILLVALRHGRTLSEAWLRHALVESQEPRASFPAVCLLLEHLHREAATVPEDCLAAVGERIARDGHWHAHTALASKAILGLNRRLNRGATPQRSSPKRPPSR